MTIREQYEAAARQKQGLRNGTRAEEGHGPQTRLTIG